MEYFRNLSLNHKQGHHTRSFWTDQFKRNSIMYVYVSIREWLPRIRRCRVGRTRCTEVGGWRWVIIRLGILWERPAVAFYPLMKYECANVVKKMAHAEGLTGTVQNDGVCWSLGVIFSEYGNFTKRPLKEGYIFSNPFKRYFKGISETIRFN